MKMMKFGLAALLMTGAVAAEEATTPAPEKVTSSLGYMDIGLGPVPIPLPNFGLGYRFQSDHNGMDLSLHAMTVVAITQLKATALYQYYFKPNLNSQFYVGGGAGVSDIFNRKKHYFVISPEFVFGKQYRNEANDTRFMQVGISWPTMNLTGHDHRLMKYPLVVFSYGIMF